ncbi:hypothetical protein CKAH01_03745 [Colletotrichum kahawae]|uniref:Uncharacterized protein n=1 Tax=Colletotrichum kahawae TaxID=34407 RepID=A0AAD9YQ00_COLKA|nr:hypothetical protein CKAH01_03745 [Colletotrichum kahawae]
MERNPPISLCNTLRLAIEILIQKPGHWIGYVLSDRRKTKALLHSSQSLRRS